MSRERLSLDGLWEFWADPQQLLTHDTLGEAAALPPPRIIRVPGPWQAQFDDLRAYSGVAWYRRKFELPQKNVSDIDQDFTHILHFGAVDYFATVWLNGTLVGEHEGGYLPFEINLDEALQRVGTNELIVRVIDPGDDENLFPRFRFPEIPHGKQSWYGPLSGIWQSVYLERRHSTYITRLHITPDPEGEQAHVDLQLNQPLKQRRGLRLGLTDPRGQKFGYQNFVIAEGEQTYRTTLPIPDPLLWDTRSPHLYQLETALLEGEDESPALDTVTSHFGMRSIAASPDGHLMLNNRILYLRGALDQDYYPEMIYTPFSDAELDEQFIKAKHMGLNCLRTHIKITDPRYYDAADRAGILIWTELPNWEHLSAEVKERARETLTGMVERDWNHPSIIIWTIVNEGWGVDLAVNTDHRAWLSDTYDYLKQLDPHRLVVGNSACFTNFHVVTDIEDFHNYYSIPDHYQQWRAWVETFAARPPWTYAHTYENIDSWRQFLRDPWKPVPRTPAPEVRRTGREPIIVSEFGNWGLPDVEKLRQGYGGRDPWWFESGIEWSDGAVYPHSIEHRFHTWHLDQVFPTLSDLARASQRMQYCALKYQIEQMRRHPSIVGYIITEFTDVHWECNGLLDMCRNPKTFYDVIADINGADAIVPEWKRVAFWEGERCELDLTLSHFSHLDVRSAKLEWSLDLFPNIKGTFDGIVAPQAQITPLGKVVFKVPLIRESVRVRLELRLLDAEGEIITRNHQELYFFPRRVSEPVPASISAPPRLKKSLLKLGYHLTDDLNDAAVLVVDRMTDEIRRYVENGGRVLWLAEAGDAQQTYLGPVGIAERQGRKWQGDWASNFNWLNQNRLFREIPTGGMVDFAFADLTPDLVITGLSTRDFASNVHAGLFVGWLHHCVALVAERRVGNGRLLISTFRLRQQLAKNPVAAIMLRDMISHLAGNSVADSA
jgi:hypothetical protein